MKDSSEEEEISDCSANVSVIKKKNFEGIVYIYI